MSPEDAYITTYTGKHFHLVNPEPDQICVEDIAHHLARVCRFGGAVRADNVPTGFYSVAEHSVFVALTCPLKHRIAGLFHDAAEAYFCDLPRPLKYLPQLAGYRDLIANAERVIAAKFGFEFPLPAIVKEIDSRIILDEQADFMPQADWGEDECDALEVGSQPLGVTLRGWMPSDAEAAFLEVYTTLGERVRRA